MIEINSSRTKSKYKRQGRERSNAQSCIPWKHEEIQRSIIFPLPPPFPHYIYAHNA